MEGIKNALQITNETISFFIAERETRFLHASVINEREKEREERMEGREREITEEEINESK